MPRPRFKASTKLLGFALPIATAATLFILLTAGGLPQIGALPDLLTYALELAPRTMYALAIGGSAALSMHFTGMNLDNAEREICLTHAGCGHTGALHVLLLETFCWLAWGVLWTVVYHPWS